MNDHRRMTDSEITPEALRALAKQDPVKALKLARQALRDKRAREQVERIAETLERGPLTPLVSQGEDERRRAYNAARQREHRQRRKEAEIARRLEAGEPLDKRLGPSIGNPAHQARLAKRRALYAMRSGHADPVPTGDPDLEAMELALLKASQGAEKPLDPGEESPHIEIDVVDPPSLASLPSWIDPNGGGSE